MGRQLDRKWTDSDRDTVVRGVALGKLSLSAAGKLVQDAAGNPMPKSTVRSFVVRDGDRFMLRDTDAARLRLEERLREIAYRMVELSNGKLGAPQLRELDGLKRAASALKEMRLALPAPAPQKPAKTAPEPATNGHAVDPDVARILGGA